LDSITEETRRLKDCLLVLTRTAAEGTDSLLELHQSGADRINTSTGALLEKTLQSLLALESHSQSAWSSMLEALKESSTTIQTDAAQALETTLLEIERMGTESKDKIEELNGVLREFWREQEGVLGQIRPFYRTWVVARRVLDGALVMEGHFGRAEVVGGWIESGFVLVFFVTVGALTLINGLRTARK